jgi:hypothetical protein
MFKHQTFLISHHRLSEKRICVLQMNAEIGWALVGYRILFHPFQERSKEVIFPLSFDQFQHVH